MTKKRLCCANGVCPECNCCICICLEELRKNLSQDARDLILKKLR